MNFRKNLTEIKRRLEERQEGRLSLAHFLVSKGISHHLALKVIDELEYNGQEIVHLKEALARKVLVTGELDFQKTHKLAFVGPTGVGKTTTVMKLAERYRGLNRKVALMSLDAGKKESLRNWAQEREIPFVNSLDESEAELLLIDTEGCNYYLENRIDLLGEHLAELGGDVEIVLTLSAAAKDVDLYGAIHQFSSLCPATLTFTKMDETLASGALVNVSVKTDIPIRYISYGYPLPGDVQVADSKSITHKILTDFNEKEFQFLRDLTISTLN